MVFIIIKGILIGVLASIPIGPIAVFVMQKCFNHGWKAGMQAALGCTFVDTVYAILSVLAYGAIRNFFDQNTRIIEIVGGLIVLGVGITMMFNTPSTGHAPKRSTSKVALDITKAALMGFSNPGAFAGILGLYAALHVNASCQGWVSQLFTVASICAGSLLYWFGFTWLASKGKNFKFSTLVAINKVSGAFVAVFGIYIFIQGLL